MGFLCVLHPSHVRRGGVVVVAVGVLGVGVGGGAPGEGDFAPPEKLSQGSKDGVAVRHARRLEGEKREGRDV